MSLDKLKKTLSELAKNSTPIQTVWVEVTEVDWEERTMTAIGVDDELEYYDVLLGLGSIDLKPKKGSTCLIGIIENQDTASFLINADNVEEICLKTYKGIELKITDAGISIEALNKPVTINSFNSYLTLNSSGIDIKSDKKIMLNGGFEALYNKVPGVPISDVSQIGSSKTVTIG